MNTLVFPTDKKGTLTVTCHASPCHKGAAIWIAKRLKGNSPEGITSGFVAQLRIIAGNPYTTLPSA